jgi:membrane protein
MPAGRASGFHMLSYFKVPIGWGELFKRTANESMEDDILGLAAQLAYYFFLALFPALLFLVALASFFHLEGMTDQITGSLAQFAPPDVVAIIQTQIQQISGSGDGGLLTIGMLLTLWSMSAAMVAIVNTLNRAYDIDESRPFWKVRLTAIGLTLALAAFLLLSFVLVVFGPALAERVAGQFGLGQAFVWAWWILQWPFVFLLVAAAISLVYHYAPDADQSFVLLTPGSVLATVLWIAFSLGFRFYLVNFADYNETYGAIGGVIVLMLWFYASGIALLAGAELNAEIEHASPYGKDVGEKTPGERKKVGVAAARAWEEEQKKPKPAPEPVRPEHARPMQPQTGEMVAGGLIAGVLGWLRGRRVRG